MKNNQEVFFFNDTNMLIRSIKDNKNKNIYVAIDDNYGQENILSISNSLTDVYIIENKLTALTGDGIGFSVFKLKLK